MTAFLPGGISVSSCSKSQEKTGRWMSWHSVSYASNIDRSPSARAACAGAVVESSNDNLRKSMGRFEMFSSVSRSIDLTDVSHTRSYGCVSVTVLLPIVQHDCPVSGRAPSYAQQRLLRHNSALQVLWNDPLARRRRHEGAAPLARLSRTRVKAAILRPPRFASNSAPSM